MKLIRSWPSSPPSGRACVYDQWPRLVMDNFDYTALAELDDDIVLIEWDIAIDRDGLEALVAAARETPDRVVVAPYRLYETTLHSNQLRKPVWAHRRADGSHVEEGDPYCAKFGLGLTYLPRDYIRQFAAEFPGQFSDGAFSSWYVKHVTDQTPIVWAARATHLHYTIDVDGYEPKTHDAPKFQEYPAHVDMGLLPEDDPDPIIAALLRERNMASRRQRPDMVVAIDEQLFSHNYRRADDARKTDE